MFLVSNWLMLVKGGVGLMDRKKIFPRYKSVYKGNLHTHTTRSDGSYSLETIINGYKKNGYQFLCISDHINYYKSHIEDNEEFIILDGMEGEVEDNGYHIHAIADYSVPVKERIKSNEIYNVQSGQSVQETIDEYNEQGNICIINHPRWTKIKYKELDDLNHYVGIEIYNTNCDRESLTGNAVDYWDYLLQRGKKVFGFASDDGHADDIDREIKEYYGGWICVSSDKLGQKDIVNSIKNGDFYASNGPEIKRIEMVGKEVFIETSLVKSIAFITYPEHGVNVYDKDGKDISQATFEMDDNINYLRIEITDAFGKKAWSNPIFL